MLSVHVSALIELTLYVGFSLNLSPHRVTYCVPKAYFLDYRADHMWRKSLLLIEGAQLLHALLAC